MTDIVERLRKYGSGYPDSLLLMREAADEIERLQAALADLRERSVEEGIHHFVKRIDAALDEQVAQ